MAKRKDGQPELIIVGEEKAQQQPAAELPKPARIPMTFDAWWLLAQQKHKLRPELKQAVKKHLESRGYMAEENYDEGLRDFGIKT